VRSRAAAELEQKRFRLIVLVMREQDDRCAGFAGGVCQRLVARDTRCLLDAAWVVAVHVETTQHERGSSGLRQVRTVRRPRIRMRGQTVMHVQCNHPVACDVAGRCEQRDGIAAAGKGHRDAVTSGHMVSHRAFERASDRVSRA
jgi:hypothetical protein